MTLAIKRMQNVGWLALVFIIAIMLYPLSLNVAAVHSDLKRIDRKIMETKREISFLEAELTTRANIAQLDEWNQLLYGYEPPTAEQFLESERALAGLNGGAPVVKPVMVSVAGLEGIIPSGEVGKPGAIAPRRDDDGAADEKPQKTAQAMASGNPSKPSLKTHTSAKSELASPDNRTARMAKIDEQLLSDSLMNDIQRRSKEERKRK
jgi:hypothetical protein